MALQIRFYLWKLRWVVGALACLCAVALSGQGSPKPTASQEARAATNIAMGQVIQQSDLAENGKHSDPTVDASEHTSFAGQTALVNIAQGSPIVPAMVAPTLQTPFAHDGLLITSVQIANPEILSLTHTGTRISLIAHNEHGTEVLVPQAVVITPQEAFSTRAESGNSLLESGVNGKIDKQSSTVLVAVLPKEAERLAQTLSWDSILMAAIVS